MNPNAIHILENNLDKVKWNMLNYYNHNGIVLLEKYPEHIDWKYLSRNPKAIHMIEQNLDKIDWNELSVNYNALHLFENNRNKITFNLLKNPNIIYKLCDYFSDIFEYDY